MHYILKIQSLKLTLLFQKPQVWSRVKLLAQVLLMCLAFTLWEEILVAKSPQNEVCVTGNIGGAVCANICKYQVGAVWAQANEKLSTKTWWWHAAISRIYCNVAKSSSEFELRNYNLQRKVTLRIVRRAGSIVNKPHQKLRSSQLVYQKYDAEQLWGLLPPSKINLKLSEGRNCDCPNDECSDQQIPKTYKDVRTADAGCSNQIHHLCFFEWVSSKHERESAWAQLEKKWYLAVHCDLDRNFHIFSIWKSSVQTFFLKQIMRVVCSEHWYSPILLVTLKISQSCRKYTFTQFASAMQNL